MSCLKLAGTVWFMALGSPCVLILEHYSLLTVSLFANDLIVCALVTVSLILSLCPESSIWASCFSGPILTSVYYAGIPFFPLEL